MTAASLPATQPSAIRAVRAFLSRYGLIIALVAMPAFYAISDLVNDGNLTRIGENLVDGLSNGSIWALVAIGYTLVYGIIELINFAHGERRRRPVHRPGAHADRRDDRLRHAERAHGEGGLQTVEIGAEAGTADHR